MRVVLPWLVIVSPEACSLDHESNETPWYDWGGTLDLAPTCPKTDDEGGGHCSGGGVGHGGEVPRPR